MKSGQIKNLLCLFSVMIITTNSNAQLVEGSYSLIKEEHTSLLEGYRYAEVGNCVKDSIWRMGLQYQCKSLQVFDNNKIYFSTTRYFDTGNTTSSSSGDYTIELIPLAENRYKAKNKLIELTLTVNNDEVEILVHNRVLHTHSRGIVNRLENISVNENIKYIFKRSGDVEKGSVDNVEKGLEYWVKMLGVSYGGYRVTEQKIVFEDISHWDSKKEVREIDQPDFTTFEVLKHNFREFYLIMETAQMHFPAYTDYAKDSKKVYYQGTVIEDINPTDFQVIDPLYAKTSENIYYKNEVIPNADTSTFESLNGGYAKDINHYYRNGEIVKKDKNIKRLLREKT